MRFSLKHLFVLLIVLVLPLGAVSAADLEQRSTVTSPVLIVNTSFLNIRSGPGVQFGIIATVTGGTPLPVLGVASDGVWYQVATDLGPGWVNVQFTLARGDFSNVPLTRFEGGSRTIETSLPASSAPIVPAGRANNLALGASIDSVDLRAQPSSQASVVRAIFGDPNTIYPLLSLTSSEGLTWAQLNIPDVGAVWTERFRLRPLGCGGASVGVLASSTQIRFDGISNQQSFDLEGGTEVFGLDVRGNQVLVQLTDGTRGFVDQAQFQTRRDGNPVCVGVSAAAAVNLGQGGGSGVAPAAVSPSGTISGNRVVVNTGNLNVRSGPSAAFSVIATVRGGTQLAVLGRARDDVWLLVEGTFGLGWLNREFTVFRGNYSTVPIIEDVGAFAPSAQISPGTAPANPVVPSNPETVSGNRVIVNTGNLNVRSGPGAAFGSIATVSGGTQLAVRGVTTDGVWYLVEGSFGQGWVNSQFVIFRGNYSIIPIISY